MNPSNLLIRAGCTVAAVVILSGCASTRVTHEWKEKSIANAPFQKVMVAGITRQEGKRRSLEDAFVADLGDQGIASYLFIEADTKVPRAVVAEAVEKAGADAMLTVSLLRTIQGRNSVPDYSGYSFYDGYYSSWYRAYNPETVYEVDLAIIEVKLYDAKSQTLVWSITTQSVDQNNLDQQVKSYSKTVTDLLRKRGLI